MILINVLRPEVESDKHFKIAEIMKIKYSLSQTFS